MKLKFEEQISKFIDNDKKNVLIENLFYTSSKYVFTGVIKLWIYNTSPQEMFFEKNKNEIQKDPQSNLGVAQPLYLFYGRNISYFFVDELPNDEVTNPTDDFSIIDKVTGKTHNPLDKNNQSFNMSKFSATKSMLHKESEPTIFSDKAMQLKHNGLCVFQIVVAKIGSSHFAYLEKNSSSNLQIQKKSNFYLQSQNFQPNKNSKDIKRILVLLCGKNSYHGVKDSIMIAQLDRELGYNFLKKIKLNIENGIFQIFESNQLNKVFVLSTNGDFYIFDFFTEYLHCLIQNPNSDKGKVKSSEFFDNGDRIAVSLDNGNFLVYHIHYEEYKEMNVLDTPFKNKNKAIFEQNENQNFEDPFNNTTTFSIYNDNNNSFNNTQSNHITISI